MANIFERFGILNASEVRLFDKSNDKLIVKILQGNSLSLEVKSDSKSAKEQGLEAITWNLGKTGIMKLSTETTSFAQLAEALGSNGLKLNSDSETYDRTETVTVSTDGSIIINLNAIPLTNSVVNFHKLTRDGELGTELVGVVDAFKVSGKGNNTGARRLVANVLCKNRVDGSMSVMQLIVPNVILENSLTLTFDADTPSKFELQMKVNADAVLKDENGDNLFFELKQLAPIITPVITPISILAVTSTVAGKADFVFPSSSDATSIGAKYKLTADSVWTDINVATTGTGVRMATAIGIADSTKQIINLPSGTYDFKLVVVDGTHAGDSNLATGVIVA